MAKKSTLAKGKEKQKKGSSPPHSHNSGWVSDLRYGRSVSLDTFRKNVWLLVPLIAVILALMGLRYKTKSRMEQIRTLTTELKRAESSKLQEKAQYMSLIRETEMLRLVEENHLGLVFREDPPVEIPVAK